MQPRDNSGNKLFIIAGCFLAVIVIAMTLFIAEKYTTQFVGPCQVHDKSKNIMTSCGTYSNKLNIDLKVGQYYYFELSGLDYFTQNINKAVQV